MSATRAFSGRSTRLVMSPSEAFDEALRSAVPWVPTQVTDLTLEFNGDGFACLMHFRAAQIKMLPMNQGQKRIQVLDQHDGARMCTVTNTGREWRLIYASHAEVTDTDRG